MVVFLHRHSAIPQFRHSAIPPFRHSAIPPFRHSAGKTQLNHGTDPCSAVRVRRLCPCVTDTIRVHWCYISLSSYIGIWNSHLDTLPLLVLSGTVSLSGNSIGSYLLPIAKVPYASPAFPSHKRAKLIILCTNLTVRLNSNTQLEHCDNSLIDVLHLAYRKAQLLFDPLTTTLAMWTSTHQPYTRQFTPRS
jgi:hypothetical protein